MVETVKILWDVIVWLIREISADARVGVTSEKWAVAVASGVDRHRQEMVV